jgi:multiple sugar transport system substrate-binding protein
MLCAVLVCGVFVAACGDDEGGGGSGGGAPSSESSGQTEGAKAIDPALIDSAKGEVSYCQGKDTSGNATKMIKKFNEEFGPDLQAKLVEFPASADEQRNQFIQRQQAKSGDCDVFHSDVIWTAEFASQKWLYDMTPYVEANKDRFIPATLETATYDGKIWGSPMATNAAFLYYRTDQIDQPPATWQAVYEAAAANDGIVFQGAPYEGLTCVWLELAFAAGGTVLSEDGTKATIDSPENVAATKLMADAVKNGAAPKAASTYMEPESITAWQTGDYTFLRNWPYAYSVSQQSANVKGKFGIVPFPEWEGGGKAGILGGGNSVISVYTDNVGAALTVVDYLSSAEFQKYHMIRFSEPSPLRESYQDPDVKKAIPFTAELEQAIEQAKARPVSPVYPQISQAIYRNVNRALSGQTSPEEAMKQAQADIEKALATF